MQNIIKIYSEIEEFKQEIKNILKEAYQGYRDCKKIVRNLHSEAQKILQNPETETASFYANYIVYKTEQHIAQEEPDSPYHLGFILYVLSHPKHDLNIHEFYKQISCM